MKKESIILIIIATIGVLCSSIVNTNSIKVEADSTFDKSKLIIEHGISATTINRKNDQFVFDNKSGYKTIYKNKKGKTIKNEYGENDFLITYNDSLYFEFRQFKTNWHNQHSYSFSFTKEKASHFIEVNIKGENDLKFKSQMNPIQYAYKYFNNRLCNNYYPNPRKCFGNIGDYENDTDQYETNNGKLYKKKDDGTNFILTCDSDGQMYLRQIQTKIDMVTAQKLGQYWIDRNNVYGNYNTSDGEMLYKIEEADVKSFQNLGNSIYGKDKNYVYDTRYGIIKYADLKTFKPIYKKGEITSSYGRDKNNYFFWNEIVVDTIEFKKEVEIE
jgi:hypothetical protein